MFSNFASIADNYVNWLHALVVLNFFFFFSTISMSISRWQKKEKCLCYILYHLINIHITHTAIQHNFIFNQISWQREDQMNTHQKKKKTKILKLQFEFSFEICKLYVIKNSLAYIFSSICFPITFTVSHSFSVISATKKEANFS